MTINEFSKVCKDFFAEHDDFKGIIHILNNKANDDGDLIGFSNMKGTSPEILGMCLIMCDKAGVSMREIALIAKNLATTLAQWLRSQASTATAMTTKTTMNRRMRKNRRKRKSAAGSAIAKRMTKRMASRPEKKSQRCWSICYSVTNSNR